MFLVAFLTIHAVRGGPPSARSAQASWRALAVFLGYDDPRGACVFRLPNGHFRTAFRKTSLLAAPAFCWAIVLVSSSPFPAFRGLLSLVPRALYCVLPAAVCCLVFWLTAAEPLLEVEAAAGANGAVCADGSPKTDFQLRTEQMLNSPHALERESYCVGFDYASGAPVLVPEEQHCTHVMVIGPPAGGKTSQGLTGPFLRAIEASGSGASASAGGTGSGRSDSAAWSST